MEQKKDENDVQVFKRSYLRYWTEVANSTGSNPREGE